jgi:hypothetical protein
LKSTIRISPKTGLAYISENFRKEGYRGDVECLPNAITLTLIRPGSSLKDVAQSLKNVVKDIELRLKYEEEKGKDA